MIRKVALDYFGHGAILKEKITCHSKLDIQIRMVLHVKDENITDMCKSLVYAAKQNAPVAKFDI